MSVAAASAAPRRATGRNRALFQLALAFGVFALVETIVFITLLLIAFVYVWRRGALEWK